MIKSFSHKGLKAFFLRGSKKGIRPEQSRRLETILDQLNAAADVIDMDFPGAELNKLNPKTKDPAQQVWSVTVSGNWRITFRFENQEAFEVKYLDYH
jgi:proteic killer suppression protein